MVRTTAPLAAQTIHKHPQIPTVKTGKAAEINIYLKLEFPVKIAMSTGS